MSLRPPIKNFRNCGQRCTPKSVNLLREPDAGDPHVRFDERDVETEHG